jgi:hypothetical protein
VIDARLLALIAVLVLAPLFLSRNIARVVGATLLAHADAIDAYRARFSSRASHWFSAAVEKDRPALVQIERRAVGER